MSRHGFQDDCDADDLAVGRWRGAVRSAIGGRRGQAALRELLAAFDAMPVKELAAESLINADGEFCTLGVLGSARGIDMTKINPDDWDAVAKAFNLAPAMVREIVFENDETVDSERWVDVEFCGPVRLGHPDWGRRTITMQIPVPDVAARRWRHMREWIASQIAAPMQDKPA